MGATISFLKSFITSNILSLQLQYYNYSRVDSSIEVVERHNHQEEHTRRNKRDRRNKPSNENNNSNMILNLKPTSYLIKYIRSKQWDNITQRLISHPNDIHFIEETNHSTTLHVAVQHRDMPIDVLRRIVQSRIQSLLTQDINGFIPLMVGLLYGLDDDGLLLLIELGGKRSIEMCNGRGWSSLHLACRVGVSIEILSKLLDLSPNMIFKANESCILPCRMLWMLFTQKSQLYESRVMSPSLRTEMIEEEVEMLWKSIVLLIQRATDVMPLETDEDRQLYEQRELLSHATCLVRKKLGLPSVCLDLVFKVHSESVSIPNTSGRLLFHNVCIVETDPISLMSIFEAYPNAAKVIDPITQSYPLSLIIKNTCSFMKDWNNVIQPIWKQHPDANCVKDVNTYLYPFMTVASCCQCDDIGNICSCLDVIYNLLLCAPHLVHVNDETSSSVPLK